MNARQQKRFEEQFPEPDYYDVGAGGPTLEMIKNYSSWTFKRKGYSAACQDEGEAVRGLVEAIQRAYDEGCGCHAQKILADAISKWKVDAGGLQRNL